MYVFVRMSVCQLYNILVFVVCPHKLLILVL